MKIEVLGFADCPNYVPALKQVQATLESIGVQAAVELLEVNSDES
jgi:hypothetical protein